MQNPFPIYPNNPFNRKPFTVEGIKSLSEHINKNNKKIDIALNTFLSLSVKVLGNLYELALDTVRNKSSKKIVSLFKKTLRYRLINSKNSQNQYTGMWVDKGLPNTHFEIAFDYLMAVPFEAVEIDGVVYRNGSFDVLVDLMNMFPQDV